MVTRSPRRGAFSPVDGITASEARLDGSQQHALDLSFHTVLISDVTAATLEPLEQPGKNEA